MATLQFLNIFSPLYYQIVTAQRNLMCAKNSYARGNHSQTHTLPCSSLFLKTLSTADTGTLLLKMHTFSAHILRVSLLVVR